MPKAKINAPRVVIVTNIPAPYRMAIYRQLADRFGEDRFHVIFCSRNESNREWAVEQEGFACTFLKQRYVCWKGRYIHYNPDVLKVIERLRPDVVITTGFNPTHLLAFVYALLQRKTHIPMTDGTFESEQKLSWLHRLIRSIVYRFSKSFIGASRGALKLYNSYGIADAKFFQSHLCIDNSAFLACAEGQRQYDLMFSGRFSPEKNPIFALDVAAGVAKALGRKVSILMVGSGPLLEQAKRYADQLRPEVEAKFPGFLQQRELPKVYGSAKLFLFPSSWDPWGVVVNEACAAGQPVIVTPQAGVADDLVRHGENGYVLALDLPSWISHATELLRNVALRDNFGLAGRARVQAFNYDAASDGIFNAVLAAI